MFDFVQSKRSSLYHYQSLLFGFVRIMCVISGATGLEHIKCHSWIVGCQDLVGLTENGIKDHQLANVFWMSVLTTKASLLCYNLE